MDNGGTAAISPQKLMFLIVGWYTSSAFAVLMLKGLFQGRFSAAKFGFPLTITATSNVVSGTLASFAYYKYMYTPPEETSTDSGTWESIKATHKSALFIGMMTAAEIGLSNAALSLLTVSLSTILKGTAPMLVMFWGIVLRIYKPSMLAFGVVVTVAIGLILAVDGSGSDTTTSKAAFDTGVMLQILSGVLSGLRWVITQIFVKSDNIGKHTINVVRLTCPYTALAIFPAVLYVEAGALYDWYAQASAADAVVVSLIGAGIGTCVFILLMAEYELVRCTSSFVVSLGFVAKEMVVIALGILFFGDRLTFKVVIGCALVQIGIGMYAFQKKNKNISSGIAENDNSNNNNNATYQALPTHSNDSVLELM